MLISASFPEIWAFKVSGILRKMRKENFKKNILCLFNKNCEVITRICIYSIFNSQTFLLMIDWQYIFMFVTENRQKTTLLWPICKAVAPLKSKVWPQNNFWPISKSSPAKLSHTTQQPKTSSKHDQTAKIKQITKCQWTKEVNLPRDQQPSSANRPSLRHHPKKSTEISSPNMPKYKATAKRKQWSSSKLWKETYGTFHVTWTSFKFNRNQLGTVST